MTDMVRDYNVILQSNVDKRFSQKHFILLGNKNYKQKDIGKKYVND